MVLRLGPKGGTHSISEGTYLFFYRDQNAVEMDFIVEKANAVLLIEAKSSEIPQAKKLNFSKVQPLFNKPTVCMVACTVNQAECIYLKDYRLYNPMWGTMV